MIAIKNNITFFIVTNATEPTLAYNSTIPYAVGDLRRYKNYLYKSTHGNNLGNNPEDTNLKDWVEWLPANDYAMLDYFRETRTYFPANTDGIVIFEGGLIDALLISDFNAEEVVIEYLDDSNNVINADDTETYTFSVYMEKYDIETYIYGRFVYDESQVLYRPLKRVGTRVRVTFKRGRNGNFCGAFFAGDIIDFGQTLDSVPLTNVVYGKKTARRASCTTVMDKAALMYTMNQADINADDAMAFIIDPDYNTAHNNIAIVGKLVEHSGTAENSQKNMMQFVVEQNIRK